MHRIGGVCGRADIGANRTLSYLGSTNAGFDIERLSQSRILAFDASAGPDFEPSITTAVHVHAILQFTWVALLIRQPLDIRSNALPLHRTLGKTFFETCQSVRDRAHFRRGHHRGPHFYHRHQQGDQGRKRTQGQHGPEGHIE
jgi:hypothetical protein